MTLSTFLPPRRADPSRGQLVTTIIKHDRKKASKKECT